MAPRLFIRLLLVIALGGVLSQSVAAQMIVPGTKQGAVRDGFSPRRPETTAAGCVGAMGEIERPGVFRTPASRTTLGDLLRWTGNPTPRASGEVRLLRAGTVQRLGISARSLGTELSPGDVLIFDARLPAGTNSTKDTLVPTQGFEISNPAHQSDTDVYLGFVGLFNRPVVARVRPEDATIGQLLAQLGQSAEISSSVRVIPPGETTAEPPPSPDEPRLLASGSVLLFEPSVLRHDRLPPPPPVFEPEGLEKRATKPLPHELGVAGTSEITTAELPPNAAGSSPPRIYGTFVEPVALGGDDSSNNSIIPRGTAPASATDVTDDDSVMNAVPAMNGTVNTRIDESSQIWHDQRKPGADLSSDVDSVERSIDVNNGKPTLEQSQKNDYAIHLGPAFEESLSRHDDMEEQPSLLRNNEIVPWVIGLLAGASLLLICGAMIRRIWSQRMQPSATAPEPADPQTTAVGGTIHASKSNPPSTASDSVTADLERSVFHKAQELVRRVITSVRQAAPMMFLRRAEDSDGISKPSEGLAAPGSTGRLGAKHRRISKPRTVAARAANQKSGRINDQSDLKDAVASPGNSNTLNSQFSDSQSKRDMPPRRVVASLTPTDAVAVNLPAREQATKNAPSQQTLAAGQKPFVPAPSVPSRIVQGRGVLGRALSRLQASRQS